MKSLTEMVCNNTTILNPTDKRGNEILIQYSKRLLRYKKVDYQDYNYNTSDILFDNDDTYFESRKGYVKGKGFHAYPTAISILVIDDLKLNVLEKEKVQYGLNPYNKGVVVALAFSDGFYIYQVDNNGKKINECEFSCSNNVKLIEEMTPELARESILIKFKCNKDSVKYFSNDQQGYYWIEYDENASKKTLFLVDPKNGNVYKNLSKEVYFNIYDILLN
jgi:hypothetical protein